MGAVPKNIQGSQASGGQIKRHRNCDFAGDTNTTERKSATKIAIRSSKIRFLFERY